MTLSARQSPHEVAIDCPEQNFACLAALAQARNIVQHPGQLGCGKIRIEKQAGGALDGWLVAGLAQGLATIGGATILPNDGGRHGSAGRSFPHHDGFALVGYANAGDGLLGNGGQRLGHGGKHRFPDGLGIVLDETRRGIALGQLRVAFTEDLHGLVQDQNRGSRGSLIDGQDKRLAHGILSLVPAWICLVKKSFTVAQNLARSISTPTRCPECGSCKRSTTDDASRPARSSELSGGTVRSRSPFTSRVGVMMLPRSSRTARASSISSTTPARGISASAGFSARLTESLTSLPPRFFTTAKRLRRTNDGRRRHNRIKISSRRGSRKGGAIRAKAETMRG